MGARARGRNQDPATRTGAERHRDALGGPEPRILAGGQGMASQDPNQDELDTRIMRSSAWAVLGYWGANALARNYSLPSRWRGCSFRTTSVWSRSR